MQRASFDNRISDAMPLKNSTEIVNEKFSSFLIDFDAFKRAPTIQESGYPEFELIVWTGFTVKAGAPASDNIQVLKATNSKQLVSSEAGLITHVHKGTRE